MMETIRVNMTPCEDIKTIHASQNDGEARQWGFELHNNGDVIDASEVTDQITFKAYKGGTEQLLPENGSTPATSPFFGDIRYPQGLLSGQEFTYRQSPTEEDGLAKITDIKGNTLGWNQLVENGDFSTSSGWTGQFATVTISNNVASVRQDRAGDYVGLRKSNLQGLTGHKYLVVADVKSAKKTAIAFYLSNAFSSAYDIQANTRTVVHAIITVSNANTGGFNVYTNRKVELAEGDVVEIYHVMCFDLTKMGLDSITDPSDFTSLFSLPYYSYNQGSLLSFNGNGIKTVGKNLLNLNVQAEDVTIAGIRYVHNSDGTITVTGTATGTSTYRIFSSTSASRFSGMYLQGNPVNDNTAAMLGFQENGGTWASYGYDYGLGVQLRDIPEGTNVWIFIRIFQGKTVNAVFKPMICFNNNETFEPYTSSTLSLPISQYFPNGMKSAGNVYDELTESKAISRIGALDLGSITWTRWTSGNNAVFLSYFTTGIKVTQTSIPKCAKYEGVSVAVDNISAFDKGNKTICYRYPTFDRIYIRDDSFTNEAELKASLNGVYLYYELATENETSFTTASLVTENAEIPLSNEDGVLVGKCTDQLSAEPGFHDAKIKLADEDGECYSNKIQLHIERSPQ